MTAMLIILVLNLIVFLIFAIVLSKGKGGYLIARYHTMSEEEKARYDEEALTKFMGKIMYGVSFSFLLWILAEILAFPALFIIGLILIILLIIFAVVYISKGSKFKRGNGKGD